MNTFSTSPNQSVLLITVCVEALIGDCVSAFGRYTIVAAPICAPRLRLMCWNPHGEMMCSAEGWQSRRAGLTVSEACWTTYMFRTAARICQRRDATNPLCSHYLPDFFPSFLLCADLCSCSCLSLYSFHISYHTVDPCLLFAGVWKSTTMSWRASGFNAAKGRKSCTTFTALIQTFPASDIDCRSNLKRIFLDRLFGLK